MVVYVAIFVSWFDFSHSFPPFVICGYLHILHEDLSIHLTNSSVQKDYYTSLPSSLEFPDAGTKCSLEHLRKLLLRKEIDFDAIWDNIRSVILKSLFAVDDKIAHDPSAFELFGYDILIDEDLRPWLLEVNASPMLNLDYGVDELIKPRMLADALDIAASIRFDGDALVNVMQKRLTRKVTNPSRRDQGEISSSITFSVLFFFSFV